MKIQKKNCGGLVWGGGSGLGGFGFGGFRVDVNEEFKFLRKLKKKKTFFFGGGGSGGVVGSEGGESGWM